MKILLFILLLTTTCYGQPVPNAGPDQTTNGTTATLTGTINRAGLSISSSWVKTSGGAANISPQNFPGQLTPCVSQVSGLAPGVYVFSFRVTDKRTMTVYSDAMQLTVTSTPNVPPMADAGPDTIKIKLPTNSTFVFGTGNDPDGTIVGYAWTKISGGAATIVNSNQASTNITGMVQGIYVFRLTVTDNRGGTAFDEIIIKVCPA